MLSGTCMRSRSCWIASIGVPAAMRPSTDSSRTSLAASGGGADPGPDSTSCGRNAPRPLGGAAAVACSGSFTTSSARARWGRRRRNPRSSSAVISRWMPDLDARSSASFISSKDGETPVSLIRSWMNMSNSCCLRVSILAASGSMPRREPEQIKNVGACSLGVHGKCQVNENVSQFRWLCEAGRPWRRRLARASLDESRRAAAKNVGIGAPAMKAMALVEVGRPLELVERPTPAPGAGEIRLKVLACGVCRTDLHVVDGELDNIRTPIVPGHEIVGEVEVAGEGAELAIGARVGVGWLGRTCGRCEFCLGGRENLCDAPEFTGYTRDGGFASHVIVDARFAYPLDASADPGSQAPLLCAGLIGWRSLVFAGEGRRLGIYGFGAAGHIIAQVAKWQGRELYAFTRPGDAGAQAFARSLGSDWAGGSDAPAPELLDAAIIYAPAGALIPAALRAVKKGGRVVCGGIHMSDIPSFPYAILWGEREVVSVANLTRQDAHDFLAIAPKAAVKTEVTLYPLERANEALSDLRAGRLSGAAVLIPTPLPQGEGGARAEGVGG